MWNSHHFICLAISFLPIALCTSKYTYPKDLKVQIHKDLVYQLNATVEIQQVQWVLWNTDGTKVSTVFFDGETLNPNLPPEYNGRLAFFGNISRGHAWYKFRNLTLNDTGLYGVKVVFQGIGSAMTYLTTNVTVIDIDECASNPCMNGGTCTDLVNGFRCTCVPGWTGARCEREIDECDSNPCLNGGTCTDLVKGFNCTCVPGSTGTRCEIVAFNETYKGHLNISKPYDGKLADGKSDASKELTAKISDMFSSVYQSSLISLNITEFVNNGSFIIVNFGVTLTVTQYNVSEPFAALKKALEASGGALHGLKIDPDSIKEGHYTPPPKPDSPDGLGTGAIIGIVIGVLAVIIITGLIICWLVKRRNHAKKGQRIPMSEK